MQYYMLGQHGKQFPCTPAVYAARAANQHAGKAFTLLRLLHNMISFIAWSIL